MAKSVTRPTKEQLAHKRRILHPSRQRAAPFWPMLHLVYARYLDQVLQQQGSLLCNNFVGLVRRTAPNKSIFTQRTTEDLILPGIEIVIEFVKIVYTFKRQRRTGNQNQLIKFLVINIYIYKQRHQLKISGRGEGVDSCLKLTYTKKSII